MANETIKPYETKMKKSYNNFVIIITEYNQIRHYNNLTDCY